jgi:tetraacyldisaccharide-1-P 4'-kinase
VQEAISGSIPDLPIPSFKVRTVVEGVYQDEVQVPAAAFKNRAVVAFAGIAKPERFFRTLESLGIHPTKNIRFRDHHHYSAREIRDLGGEMLITTEKDAVRLRTVTDRPYSYLRISAKIPDFDGLMSLILNGWKSRTS